MAISAPHYEALKELARRGELPIGGRILEIGEANWYCDQSTEVIFDQIRTIPDESRRFALAEKLARVCHERGQWSTWDVAKIAYSALFDPSVVRSIDFNGTPTAEKTDLNEEVEGFGLYQLCINHGTAEHIFNIGNVFRAMHDNCCVGGLMIHESPFTGWVDHGFYTLQPTLFYDVAAANEYDIRYVAIEHIESKLLQEVESREQIHELARAGQLPNNAMLYVALRKTTDAPFKIPMQGVYAKTVSPEVQASWRALR